MVRTLGALENANGPFNIFSLLDKMLGTSPNFESDKVWKMKKKKNINMWGIMLKMMLNNTPMHQGQC